MIYGEKWRFYYEIRYRNIDAYFHIFMYRNAIP